MKRAVLEQDLVDVEGLELAPAEPVYRFGYVRDEFGELVSWWAATASRACWRSALWDTN